MYTLSARSLHNLPKTWTIRPSRRIVGRRFPRSTRRFHTSPKLQTDPYDPADLPESASNRISTLDPYRDGLFVDHEQGRPFVPSHSATENDAKEYQDDNGGDEPPRESKPNNDPTKPKDNSPYGSAFKRATRSTRRAKDASTVHLPGWFLDKNVNLAEHLSLEITGVEGLYRHSPDLKYVFAHGKRLKLSTLPDTPDVDVEAAAQNEDPGKSPMRTSKYRIDRVVFSEISNFVTAGLQSAIASTSQAVLSGRPHLVLQSPKRGGALFLESTVRGVAKSLGADLIGFNAQDVAELADSPLLDVPSKTRESLRTLGYETHLVEPSHDHPNGETGEGLESFFGDGEEGGPFPRPNSMVFPAAKPKKGQSHSKVATLPFSDLIKSVKSIVPHFAAQASPQHLMLVGRPPSENMDDPPELSENHRARVIMDSFLHAPQMKRVVEKARNPGSTELSLVGHGSAANESPVAATKLNPLIVLVQDYLELCSTNNGSAFINMLHHVVDQRRGTGQRIIIIGITSSEDLVPSLTREGFKSIQNEPGQSYQAIVTPCNNSDADSILAMDEKIRVQQINERHLQAMLRQIAPRSDLVSKVVSNPLKFDSSKVFAWGLNESVWTFEQVQRVATLALGVLGKQDELSQGEIEQAMFIIDGSDRAKYQWLETNNAQSDPRKDPNASTEELRKAQEERIKQLRKTCNKYEKKLLGGAIDARNIHTTFDNVHAPPETIDALKTLTTLSLTRPDAFSYGVLATDRITGLLLYGPPGTGKTLLARAAAKAGGGATVLEVAGSDVYDKYVGEGEKNVRAVFSLARKLSPCVVFIDEADAILGSRSQTGNRTSHRELINQFLREWDGLQETSAFIMVATNRPFDLDDAALRRLPRRLLVDLPTEKDREEILKIHLRGEQLDDPVSLQELAARTPFYSGSDLKNLCVAAALACVREENDMAAAAARKAQNMKDQGKIGATSETDSEPTQPYRHPKKRTLTKPHFEKGLAEISASISEDMSSLSAIRKFDEKYGDQRARKKKLSGWGFATATQKDKEKERAGEGRVRSDEVR